MPNRPAVRDTFLRRLMAAGTARKPSRVIPPAALLAAAGEYINLPLSRIVTGPWQARRVFSDIEELAATIDGSATTRGVGVLVPLLVRHVEEDDTYQLIDGARRVRALQLIAERSGDQDLLVPARVFRVSERVAGLMALIANLERSQLCPAEVALGYLAIRTALREEIGKAAGSLRALTRVGHLGKTQIGDYLRIAELLTDGTLEAAGLTCESGEPDFERLCVLTKEELHKVARCKDREERAGALKARIEVRTGIPSPRSTPARQPRASTPEARRAEIMNAGFTLKVREPAHMLAPSRARDVVESELVPAVLALTERAYGGHAGEGFFASTAHAHVVLALPTELEALTTAQLERLTDALSELRSRAGRALRMRRAAAKQQAKKL